MVALNALTRAVGDLDDQVLASLLAEFMASNPSIEDAQKVVNACQRGMTIVGDKFEEGEYFIGDLMFAGELLKKAIDIIKPVLSGLEMQKTGTIVIGTVKGDLHDIGKNIFIGMAEAAGFEVHDLGINVPPDLFVQKVKEVKPHIVGMSGVLALSLNSMQDTVDELVEAGLRSRVKIIIGGNPVTEEACKKIGADAYTTNAAEGLKICEGWMEEYME